MSNNPETFAGLQEAAAAQGYDGLGLGLFGSSGLGAIDIDHCVNNGVPNELAADIIRIMDSYSEYSPSGEGIRILFYAPGLRYDTARYYINNQRRGLEVYIAGCTKKFVTLTGNVLRKEPIKERTAMIANVLERYMVRPSTNTGQEIGWNDVIGAGAAESSHELDDVTLLDMAGKARNGETFKRLYAGDTFGYNSHSEADQALCNLLAFWTGKDSQRMDALFRGSGLMREKWDRRQSGTTYGAITIQKAISGCREVFTPGTQKAGASPSVPQKPQEAPQRAAFKVISAVELQRMVLAPVEWAVVNLLPNGFNLLASPPKYGKSWWVLDLGLAVATGTNFMGRSSVKGRCLYLALEDSENRLKSRLNKLLQGRTAPESFDFVTQSADMDNGLMEQLEGYISAHSDTRLIIIDTLQKVRGSAKRTESAYQADYREAGRLKAFADAHHVCLLCVHHLRKMADDGDPFNRISGTNGLLGAADTALVMTRNKRNDSNTTLSITGRDVEPSDEIITFDKESCRWRLIGSADQLLQQSARMEYEQEPMVEAVTALLEEYPEGWEGTASDLMEECGKLLGCYPVTSVRGYTDALKKLKPQLWNYDRVRVDLTKKRHNSRVIQIFKCKGQGETSPQSPLIPPCETVQSPLIPPFAEMSPLNPPVES